LSYWPPPSRPYLSIVSARRTPSHWSHREAARNSATNQTSPWTDLINAWPSCAAGILRQLRSRLCQSR
jgi:hypothetical protein